VGVYNGAVSYPGIKETIESSDFIINTGPILSDSNTGGFTRSIPPENIVEIHPEHTIFKGKKYTNVSIKPRLSLPHITNVSPVQINSDALTREMSKGQ
jgi:pyruvate decarboxylase